MSPIRHRPSSLPSPARPPKGRAFRRMNTPRAIATLALNLSPDVADVLRYDAPTLAAGLRREGFTGIGEETVALEGCIRHYLDASDAA